jgi:sugar phosphate isomerase/epimerase
MKTTNARDDRIRRRTLLKGLAAGLAGAVAGVGTAAAATRQAGRQRWGVQLYTVRGLLAKDAAATLERVAAIGYTELEVLQPTLGVVAPIARRLGLSIVAAHLDATTAAGNGLSVFAAEAKAHGLRYLVVPFVPPGDRPRDRAGFQRVGQRLALMAAEARAAGLELCYHNHAFEFGADADGTRWLDVIMEETATAGMKLELDVFWAAVTGADPVAVIKQYAGRVPLLHLKDKHPKVPNLLVEGQVPRDGFVEVGAGTLNFPAILAAARTAGVSHYFVEQDATPGDPIESLGKSYTYLARLDLR